MIISVAGINAIREREGERLKAYKDSRGVWTIGVGHTGPEVARGLVWTRAKSTAVLKKDLGWAMQAVNDDVTVPLTQNQFDALVSLTFNIGSYGFLGSSVRKQLNKGNTKLAADDFLMWEKPPELKTRREGERKQFLTK